MEKVQISFMAKIAMMIAGFYAMADMFVVSPIVGDIATAFPDASASAIEMTVALSQLTVMVASLLCAPLARVLSKKTLLLIGAVLVAVAGGFGGAVHDITYILVMRGLQGFGAGFCITLTPIIIAELTEGDEMRRLIGWQTAVGCALGALCSVISGKIAVTLGWDKSYYLYFFSLVIIAVVLVWLPGTPVEQKTDRAEKPNINTATWLWCVVALLFGVLTSGLFIKEAVYFQETGIGDADFAGASQSVITIGSFVGGLILARLYRTVKGFMDFVPWFMIGLGIAAIVFFQSHPIIYIGSFLFGLGNGILFPWLFAKGVAMATPGTETASISFINVAYYIGMFVAVFVYQGLGSLFNDESALFAFTCMLAGTAIITFVYFLGGFKQQGAMIQVED